MFVAILPGQRHADRQEIIFHVMFQFEAHPLCIQLENCYKMGPYKL